MEIATAKVIYEPVIGIEVHTELSTRTKMFCDCKNDPNETQPNTNICPVCMGHPGTLPVINQEAVIKVIKAGLGLGGEITQFSQFDRKNYFYPDLPKGYQISQYKYPIVSGGSLNGVRITRVHLEEDAGRLQHIDGDTLVDYNRAGVPLMELVTEPDIRSAVDAKQFAEELRLLFLYVGASEADMEKGQMRIEANISIRPVGSPIFGTKVEVKNINSFRAVEKAILYEIKRQTEALEAGETLKQETRGWNDVKEITVSQRSKEGANDYRYFPEPDLPPLRLTKEEGFDIEMMGRIIPELPAKKRERFTRQYGLQPKTVQFFADNPDFANYFESAASELLEWMKTENDSTDAASKEGLPEKAEEKSRKVWNLLANYLTSDLQFLLTDKSCSLADTLISPENLAELIKMIYKEELSSRAAKDVLAKMFSDGSDPSSIVEEGGLRQVSDSVALEELVRKIIEENPQPVADYKNGKEAALQVLVGKIMQATKGAAHPQLVRGILTKILS